MTDDYLLQEFHEAGIWLPGERMRREESGIEAFIRIQVALEQQLAQRKQFGCRLGPGTVVPLPPPLSSEGGDFGTEVNICPVIIPSGGRSGYEYH